MKNYLPHMVSRIQAAVFLAAVLQVLFGLITLVFHQEVFSRILESQLVVREGTKTFDAWVETPIPIYTGFYFFNMLNAEAFQKNHDKPIVEEKGPYTFREVTQKVDLVWNKDGTVSYKRRKFWYFVPERSVGNLTDTVVTLNLPMVGAVDYARGDFMMEYGISDILSTVEATLFINRTIGELLFEGYEDPVLEMGTAAIEEEDEFEYMFEEEEYYGEEEVEEENPMKPPFDKFGWFYKRNGTTWADGDLTMHTGQDNIENLGKIVSWNHSNRTEAFTGACGQVEGSSDGLFAPGVLEMKDSFDIWSTDTCRKLTFSRMEEEHSEHGIKVDKFKLADDVFANGSVCSDNFCYNNNLPTGVQNVSQCKMKAPAFLSRPHFHLADKFFEDQFQIGINPQPEKHESFFMIEPATSIPVKVYMALQLNILIEKSEGIPYVFENLPRVFFPVLWFESVSALPESQAIPLLALINLPTIMMVAAIVGVITGLTGMVWVYHCVYQKRTRNMVKQETEENSEKIEYKEKNEKIIKYEEENQEKKPNKLLTRYYIWKKEEKPLSPVKT